LIAAVPPSLTRAAIVGIAGPILLPEETALLRACPPVGVILFSRNIQDPGQLALLMADLQTVLPPDSHLMVDQEGGRVARLRPPHWRSHPAAALIGDMFRRDAPIGLRLAWLTGALIGIECLSVGFTVAAVPVLDLSVPGAHDVIGDRALGQAPSDVACLGRAIADGLLAAGVIPVGKHIPGHGRASVDSHLALPRITGDHLESDLQPFILNADLPWMMTAHIVYEAFDPDMPATLSASVISDIMRRRIGYKGVLVTDDLAMKALSGLPVDLALRALAAGCDIALYCSGDFTSTEALLRACPPLTPLALARVHAARSLAERTRIALMAEELAEERSRLMNETNC